MYVLRLFAVFVIVLAYGLGFGCSYALECGGMDNGCLCDQDHHTLVCTQMNSLPDVENNVRENQIVHMRIAGLALQKFPRAYFSRYPELEILDMYNMPFLDCQSVPDDLSYDLFIPNCQGKSNRVKMI